MYGGITVMYSKWHAIRAIDDTKQFTTALDSEGNEIVTWADGETPISDSDITHISMSGNDLFIRSATLYPKNSLPVS